MSVVKLEKEMSSKASPDDVLLHRCTVLESKMASLDEVLTFNQGSIKTRLT